MARYRMTSRRRAALRKAQLASARKRKGHGKRPISRKRKVAIGAAVSVAAAATVYGAYRGTKTHKSRSLRKDIRHHLATDRTRQHNRTHVRAHHLQRQGKIKLDKDLVEPLHYARIFTNKVSKKRVATRRGMTAKQKRASIPKRRKAKR